MSILVRYAPTSLTREQYDKVNEIMRANAPGGPPPALQLHAMFGDEQGLLVSEIWESEEAWQQAWDAMMQPALSSAGVDVPKPQTFALHELWGSSVKG